MKLYYSPGSCSQAPHIVLRETSTPIDLVRVNIFEHTCADGRDFNNVNPKGYVPVLELDDGQMLTEGPVISQYIADRARREDLMPAPGTLARYRVLEWQNYITSELHKSFQPLFRDTHSAQAKEIFSSSVRRKLEWVSSLLASQRYLTGESFTAADAYLFVVVNWSTYVDLDLSDLAPLQSFLSRVRERPGVKAALQAEGLK